MIAYLAHALGRDPDQRPRNIVLVGGEDTRQSQGAQAEKKIMIELRKGVCDLTFLGDEPPMGDPRSCHFEDEHGQIVRPTRENMTELILSRLQRNDYSNPAPATSMSR